MTAWSTDRLVVRPWLDAEAGRLFDIRSRREISKWLSDPEPWSSIEQARTAIASWAEIEPPCGVWAITVDGQPVGSIALHELDGDEVEIGWYLHPNWVGRGFAREAARLMLDHALDSGIDRVWAIMWPHNEPSARVAEGAGMTRLGICDDPWYGTADDPESLMYRYPE